MVAPSRYTSRCAAARPAPLLPDPLVLFFLLGLAARLLRSDLRLPEALYEALALYLLLAIGLKGGIELASHAVGGLGVQVAGVLALGFATPLVAYAVLRGLGRLAGPDAASIAGHYGSVSVVTFAVAAVGAWTGPMLGFSVGGATLLATLAASASYIAAPSAMRIAIPEANPALSLTAALGVTFPFNIVVGIPLYHRFAAAAAA